MKHYLNVCDVNGAEIAPVDVITFGSPCQDLSVAGKRAGLDGQRSGLFMEAVRIIKEMREKTNGSYQTYAMWENVPGDYSSNKGDDFRTVLEELAKISDPSVSIPGPQKGKWSLSGRIVGSVFSIAWRCLDAQYHGVPQRRRRIILVCDFAGERAGKILFECRGLPGYPAKSIQEGEENTADIAKDAGEPSGIWPEIARSLTARHDGSPCIDRGPNIVAFHLTQDPISSEGVTPCISAGNSAAGQASIGVCGAFSAGQSSQAGSIAWDEQVAPTIRGAGSGTNQVPTVCLDYNAGNTLAVTEDKTAPLTASQNGNLPMVCIPINDKATRYKGGGPTRNGDGAGNGLGVGKPGDPAPTLTSADRHAVFDGRG